MVVSVRSEAVENGKCSFLYEPNRSKMNKKNVIIGSLLPEKKKFDVILDHCQHPFKVLNFSVEKKGSRP
jgi:hypothetical protein